MLQLYYAWHNLLWSSGLVIKRVEGTVWTEALTPGVRKNYLLQPWRGTFAQSSGQSLSRKEFCISQFSFFPPSFLPIKMYWAPAVCWARAWKTLSLKPSRSSEVCLCVCVCVSVSVSEIAVRWVTSDKNGLNNLLDVRGQLWEALLRRCDVKYWRINRNLPGWKLTKKSRSRFCSWLKRIHEGTEAWRSFPWLGSTMSNYYALGIMTV